MKTTTKIILVFIALSVIGIFLFTFILSFFPTGHSWSYNNRHGLYDADSLEEAILDECIEQDFEDEEFSDTLTYNVVIIENNK